MKIFALLENKNAFLHQFFSTESHCTMIIDRAHEI